MKTIPGYEALQDPPGHAVLTIGNFDGVHLGHRKIIGLAVEKAKARGGTSVAFTFKPHPLTVLRPGAELQLLSTHEEKVELLGALGIDIVIEQPFGREFSSIPAERFFLEAIRGRIGAEAIVVGYDFGFGKDRQGGLRVLEKMATEAGIELTIVPQQKQGDETVSSSRIRQCLLNGDIASANRLLGRPFSYRGIVVRGEGRGRKIGFPTANLKQEIKLSLPNGVYATRTLIDGTVYPSVTNVGVRPTFQGDGEVIPAVLIESHLLDLSRDLYGKPCEVRFVAKIREERRFAGMEALRTQIGADIKLAREIFSRPSAD